MDVFALTDGARAYFAAAAYRAAEELGLFAALQQKDPASALGLAPRRLGILIEALREEGLLEPGARPPAVPVVREGWGLLAEVIRRDRPLPASHLDAFHAHLAEAGREAAEKLAARLIEWAQPPTLLDLGGGRGTYARAFVARGGSALVVDRKEVLPPEEPGLRCLLGDVFEVEEGGFGVVLLCNLLHLYGKSDCARLCARARRLGGVVVVKDLDRQTAAGRWFALNMALYTDEGDVHSADEIVNWLGGGQIQRMGDHLVVRT